MKTLIVDCATCSERGRGCSDCVISALLEAPAAAPTELDDVEQQALAALAGSGLLPPLRLVQAAGAGSPQGGLDDIPEKMRRICSA